MFCKKCGAEIENEGSVCNKCGFDNAMHLPPKNQGNINGQFVPQKYTSSFDTLVKVAFCIAAIAIVIMCFSAADDVAIAASNMKSLKSVSGGTVNEYYYNYYGRFISGIAGFIRAMGVAFGGIFVYLARKF